MNVSQPSMSDDLQCCLSIPCSEWTAKIWSLLKFSGDFGSDQEFLNHLLQDEYGRQSVNERSLLCTMNIKYAMPNIKKEEEKPKELSVTIGSARGEPSSNRPMTSSSDTPSSLSAFSFMNGGGTGIAIEPKDMNAFERSDTPVCIQPLAAITAHSTPLTVATNTTQLDHIDEIGSSESVDDITESVQNINSWMTRTDLHYRTDPLKAKLKADVRAQLGFKLRAAVSAANKLKDRKQSFRSSSRLSGPKLPELFENSPHHKQTATSPGQQHSAEITDIFRVKSSKDVRVRTCQKCKKVFIYEMAFDKHLANCEKNMDCQIIKEKGSFKKNWPFGNGAVKKSVPLKALKPASEVVDVESDVDECQNAFLSTLGLKEELPKMKRGRKKKDATKPARNGLKVKEPVRNGSSEKKSALNGLKASNARGFKCLCCRVFVATKSGLNRHYWGRHKKYLCGKCMKVFPTEASQAAHAVKAHSGSGHANKSGATSGKVVEKKGRKKIVRID